MHWLHANKMKPSIEIGNFPVIALLRCCCSLSLLPICVPIHLSKCFACCSTTWVSELYFTSIPQVRSLKGDNITHFKEVTHLVKCLITRLYLDHPISTKTAFKEVSTLVAT